MRSDLALIRRDGRWIARLPGRGAIPACTVSEACRRLRRSRRHVYRLISEGVLSPLGTAFGHVLLSEAEVGQLAGAPKSPQRLPAALAPLFPEYDLGTLNVGRDRDLIVARVLDRGGLSAARWLARRLPKAQIARSLERDGARLMSPRALRLWLLVFGAKPTPLPSWRRLSNPWLARRS